MSQFGGSEQDDYGYFSAPKGPSSGGSQFGGPAASPFGTPPPPAGADAFGGGNQAFGTPAPYSGTGYRSNQPPLPPRRTSKLKFALIPVLVVGALWVGNFVYTTHAISKPIAMPNELGGRPAAVDPRMVQVQTQTLDAIRAANGDMTIEAKIYGDTRNYAVGVVARGRLDVDKEWRDAGSPARVTIGKNQCAQLSDHFTAVCLRTSRTLAVEVLLTGPTSEASAALDDLWNAQP